MSIDKLNHNYVMNNGWKIPGFGFGSGASSEGTIRAGIKMGYRLFDTAFFYRNERTIGKALQAAFKEDQVKREDLFIVSKLWNSQHRPEKVLPSIKRSLEDLQLEYLDLYLIHWPFAAMPENEYVDFSGAEDPSVCLEDTWRAMEDLVRQGYAKSIGLSNCNSLQIERILKIATIRPVVNQVECNPFFSQEKLREFCKEKDILIMAYCPLYSPWRVDSSMLREPVIEDLARKYQKTSAQIVLRYMVQCEVIPIPKTENLEHLKSNIDIYDFVIVPDDFAKLRLLNRNERCNPQLGARHYKEYPFNAEF